MDVCVWVSVCVRGWVAFLTGVRMSRGTNLSILARGPHKELKSENLRDQKRGRRTLVS